MAGQPEPGIVAAMRQVQAGAASPYAAAKMEGVTLSTMYRSALYKLHQAGKTEELERALTEAEQRFPNLIRAMRQIHAKAATPAAAADNNGVPRPTLYSSHLYQLHKAGKTEELERALTDAESRFQQVNKTGGI